MSLWTWFWIAVDCVAIYGLVYLIDSALDRSCADDD